MSAGEVVVAGHLCLDMTPTFPAGASRPLAELFRPGVLINMDRMVISTGGTVSNTGIALRIFGCDVASVAKVGDDAIGSLILRVLERHGNAEGIRIEAGATSSYSVVIAPPGVDRVFLHCTGTNDTFGAEDVDYGLVARARVFHFGYPPLMRRMFEDGGSELATILRRARETGVTTSLDMAMPDPGAPSGAADWRRILSRALPHVDIFVPSIEEAFYCLHKEEYLERKALHRGEDLLGYMELEDFRTVGEEAIEMGCGLVALKAGARGWYFRTAGAQRLGRLGRLAPREAGTWADREVWCPAFRVEHVASATGSGDSSIAGFLTAMLRGRGLEDCLHLANCAGAHNLAGVDSVSGLKSWDEVEADARRLPLADLPFLRGTEWRYSPEGRVWERPKGGSGR
jgi:sugar/nucleoside kinase (ribokinase family)